MQILKAIALAAALTISAPAAAIDTVVANDEIYLADTLINACKANITEASQGQASTQFITAACNCVILEVEGIAAAEPTLGIKDVWWNANANCIDQSTRPGFIEYYIDKGRTR